MMPQDINGPDEGLEFPNGFNFFFSIVAIGGYIITTSWGDQNGMDCTPKVHIQTIAQALDEQIYMDDMETYFNLWSEA